MIIDLKTHPFPVEAFFDTSLVLTFAVPKEEIQHLIPSCLYLDTLDDKWAFIAVAVVQTRKLKPKGFPTFLGMDFSLVGYRIFVKYVNNADKRLRGLYILKSETDKKKMEYLGNIFTHYKYTTTDISLVRNKGMIEIKSVGSDFSVTVETNENSTINLPVSSPFADWKIARRFAGPLPFTFTFLPDTNQVLIIEGVRENWDPNPVKILHHHFSFLDDLKLYSLKLASAFIVEKIPYCWKKGKLESWTV